MGCLIKFDDPMDLLQYTEKNRRLYVYSTGLQVKRNDTFTFQLCKDCYINMKLACKFKKQCRVSDKRFRHYLGLKEAGDTTDFCNFLKNNDDTFMFRFPLISGNSTPANSRANKDDDNESTCTSIRNFMTDILRADDIPDTEARIIREVIEEEADVLDDSLDSHWLQDDVSIDNDNRLDFSFSPFSTPHSVNNERCYTPQKLKESFKNQLQFNNYVLKEILKENSLAVNEPVKDESVEECVTLDDNHAVNDYIKNEDQITIDETEFTTNENHGTINDNNYITNDNHVKINESNYITNDNHGKINENNYISNDNHGKINENNFTTNNNIGTINENNYTTNENHCIVSENHETENKAINVDDDNKNGNYVKESVKPECTIDKNLKEALKNDNEVYSLKDLLGTPQVFAGASAMSTPTITNILFGEKLDLSLENEDSDKQIEGQCIENHENVEGEVDILEEFFQKTTEEFDLNDKNPLVDDLEDPDPWNPLQIKYNLKDFFCNLCKKTFKSEKAIKIHIAKRHGERIIGPKKKYNRIIGICDYCGNKYHDRASIKKHIKLHLNPHQPCMCKICKQKFTSKAKLTIHMAIHTGKRPLKKPKNKFQKHVCNVCGFSTSKGYSLTVHKKRHDKSYTHTCEQCGKGFCTKSEMVVHVRGHNGDKPFVCAFCDKKFARRDTLNKHTKIHTGERPYKCDNCKMEFIMENALKQHKLKSSKCLQKRHKSIVERLISTNMAGETYFYIESEDTPESIVPEITEETSNLS